MITREQLAQEYINYVNNYAFVALWAEHRGLSEEEGKLFWSVCRAAYYSQHPEA